MPKLILNSIIVGGFTFLSRVLGLVRDFFIAKYLGTSKVADCFFAAFKIPNLFRRVFAEGAFNNAFVPLFAGRLEDKGQKKAHDFAIKSFSVLFYFLLIFTVLAEIFMPLIVKAFTPGFINDPEKMALTIELSRIVFPFLMFISITAFFAGILNSIGKFAKAAAMPIILNVFMIVGVIFFNTHFETTGHTLSYMVSIAGLVQLLILGFAAYKKGFGIFILSPKRTIKSFKHHSIRILTKNILPGIVGGGIYHINIMINTIFASLENKAISRLYYADRITQLPLGVIGIAIGTVLLPMISKHLKSGKHKGYTAINHAIEVAMLLIIPCMLGLMAISFPLISLLFERGAFTVEDSFASSFALRSYAIGLPFIVFLKLLSVAFYARKDTKTPVKIGAISIVANIILIYILSNVLGFAGIALATSISALIQSVLLYIVAHRKGYFIFFKDSIFNILRITLASIFMYIIVDQFKLRLTDSWYFDSVLDRGLAVFFLLIIGTVSYMIGLLLTGLTPRKFLNKIKS